MVAMATSAWHVIGAALVFLLGAGLAMWLASSFRVSVGRSMLLYLWHTGFCLFYMDYTLSGNVSDALSYYRMSLIYDGGFEVGTAFVELFASVFSVYLGLSYLGVFLVFHIFGFVGLMAFYGSLRIATADKSRLLRQVAFLILLMPSIHFWSAALGKDALSFMATGLALWAALEFRQRKLLMFVAIIIMLLVRPHIASLMVLALAVSTVLDPRLPLLPRVGLASIVLAGAAAMLPFALNYAGLGDASSASDVVAYIESRQGTNLEGGSSVDIASMSLPMQLFTYLFRPLPYEASSLFSLAASLDNILLLALFVIGGRGLLGSSGNWKQENRVFLLTYALSVWLILSLTTANLGIAVRQKWMFTPVLIYLLMSAAKRVERSPSAAWQPSTARMRT